MAWDTLKNSAKEHNRRHPDEWALSFVCVPGLDARAAAEFVGPQRLPNPQMRQSTAGRLRDVGLDVFLDGQPGHASIMYPGPLSDADCQNLVSVFDEPEPNPAAPPKGARNARP